MIRKLSSSSSLSTGSNSLLGIRTELKTNIAADAELVVENNEELLLAATDTSTAAGSKIQHQPHVTGNSHRLKVVQISFFSRLLIHPQLQEASHSHSHIHVDVIKIISNMLLFMLARVCQILK